jgi:hypothetical protein
MSNLASNRARGGGPHERLGTAVAAADVIEDGSHQNLHPGSLGPLNAASRAPPWLPSDGDVGAGVFLGLPGVVVDKNARGERQTIQAAEVDLADRSFPACS